MNRLTVILCAGATLALCGSCAGYRSGLRRHDPKTAELADRESRKKYDAYLFDNGPDYVSEGLFRIVGRNGRIGYADTTGRVVIRPHYEAAYPFQDGHATVARQARKVWIGEHFYWESDRWKEVDPKGRKVKGSVSLHRNQ